MIHMNRQEKNNFERIVEIIIYVISELRQNKNIAEIDVNELQDRGYTKTEISTAFSWLADRNELSEEIFEDDEFHANRSYRVLHEAERELFTREAWGEMIQLHSLGILNNEHIEQIIERSLTSGIHLIDSEHLKAFVAMTIFNASDSNSFGSRIMLDGSDSIN